MAYFILYSLRRYRNVINSKIKPKIEAKTEKTKTIETYCSSSSANLTIVVVLVIIIN